MALDYRPTLTDDEYRVIASDARVAPKVMSLAASTARAALSRPPDGPVLVHRLRLLSPFPGLDPPRSLDLYDIDDALFLGSPAEVNRHFQWAKQEARRCVTCLRRARLVLAGNSYLADQARRHATRVEVVPSCVDSTAQPIHEHRAKEVVTIGWIGSPTTAPYLQAVIPVLARLNEGRPRAKLVVVGGETGVNEPWIEHRPWSLASEGSDLAGFDIGIMPLPDTQWARGKCGYKILQYFSAGVPAVSSDVGVSRELIGDERGLLASTAEEWRTALELLIDSADERRERGTAARRFVERHYSYEHWAPIVAELMRSVADGSV